MTIKLLISIVLLAVSSSMLTAQKKNESDQNKYWLQSEDLSGLKFRSIGPALTSGRI